MINVSLEELQKMNDKELLDTLVEAHRNNFYLEMKDRWSNDDFALSNANHVEIRMIENVVNERNIDVSGVNIHTPESYENVKYKES